MRNALKNPVIADKKKAPCKENIFMGDQVDVYRFPAPMIHEGDVGRYIGTWDLVVTKDPETDPRSEDPGNPACS
jgi:UbiD family decarboxylase